MWPLKVMTIVGRAELLSDRWGVNIGLDKDEVEWRTRNVFEH
jgi:hypothetical protein